MTEQSPNSFEATKPSGKTVTVDPAKKKYRPGSDDSGKNKVYYEGGTVNGTTYDPGFYFWAFWLATEANHEPSQEYTDAHPDDVNPGNDDSTPAPTDDATPAPDGSESGGSDDSTTSDSSSSDSSPDSATADAGGGSDFGGGDSGGGSSGD